MELFVWLDQVRPMLEELNCILMVNGVQSVMMDGMILMLVWCVDNWDLDCQESHYNQNQEEDKYYSMMLIVLVMNHHY